MATLFGVVLLVPMVLGLAWLLPHALDPATWSARNFTLGTRLLSETRIVVDYIAWILLPLPQWLSFYHDGFVISRGLLQPWTTLVSIVVIVALLALPWSQRRRRPLVALGIALYFGCHLLTATILPLELVYEHRNYFASFGILLAVVPLLARPGALSFARRSLLVLLAVWWVTLTALTAYQWGSPLRLAFALATRAPQSPRAQYELGRTLMTLGNYNPRSPYTQRAYAPLQHAAAIPGTSILSLQALIFMNVRMGKPVPSEWWNRLIAQLKAEPPGPQDVSSLGALADCAFTGACPIDKQRMVAAFEAALSHPGTNDRVLAIYGSYRWNVLGDAPRAVTLMKHAINANPEEPGYRVDLARMASVLNHPGVIKQQITAMQQMNVGGRLQGAIAELKNLLARSHRTRPPRHPDRPADTNTPLPTSR